MFIRGYVLVEKADRQLLHNIIEHYTRLQVQQQTPDSPLLLLTTPRHPRHSFHMGSHFSSSLTQFLPL